MPSAIPGRSTSRDMTAIDPYPGSNRTYSAPNHFPHTSLDPPGSATPQGPNSSNRGRRAPRMSSHIPPPPAIDQSLERNLDSATGVGVALEDMLEVSSSRDVALPFEPIIVPKNTYTIWLVLDTREIRGRLYNRDYIRAEIEKRGVCVEQRALELGDVCWIAKRNGLDGPNNEVVLDFILERKRAKDLVGSIKDGRFHEQKFRLKESGIGHIYYLVEQYRENVEDTVMDKAIFTALSSTQIIDGFFVKETRDLSDTIEYLVGLHETIL
ncbi:restriction endonuclease type II-like protein, partial [Cantharellus anzutake]|uniref:restriction endonuclease type II-like protein n=1 Tax=Cantharellus anzutake TaxID=1750568 RepID=UPI0019071635